ncbi:hypothetical protein V6N13_033469 [Hibiscus sabdariffa]
MQGTGPEGVYVRSNCSARALMMVLQEEKVNRMDLRKSGDLVDMQHFQHGGSVEFFYRLHHSELDHGRKISNLIIVIVSLVVAGCLAATLWLVWRYKTKLKVSSKLCCKDHDVAVFDLSNNKSKEFTTDLPGPTDILIDGNQVNGPDLQNFNFSCIATATKNFCEENRLGQGGFGAVYKVSFSSLVTKHNCVIMLLYYD